MFILTRVLGGEVNSLFREFIEIRDVRILLDLLVFF